VNGINMENLNSNTENVMRYVVMVHGQPCGPRYPTPEAATIAISMLSEAHQSIAEIVPVTESGDQLLLG